MSIFLFILGALMLALAVRRITKNRSPLRPPILLWMLAATGSGLVTAAALVAIAP